MTRPLRLIVSTGVVLALVGFAARSLAQNLSVACYNINGAGAPASLGRLGLQRIVDYLSADVFLLQEGKGLANLQDFIADNPQYESVYSSADGAGNRRVVMSRFPIVAGSVIEHDLGGNGIVSKRTLLEATIDIPGQDLVVWVAHWDASSNAIRVQESSVSAAIVEAALLASPGGRFVYAGDLNEVDSDPELARLLDSGLGLISPPDPNNGRIETLNANPAKTTYLSRRVDYLLPSNSVLTAYTGGVVLNSLTFPAGALPLGLETADTVDASDHLPVLVNLDFGLIVGGCGDVNADGVVNVVDALLVAQFEVGLRSCASIPAFDGCDVNPAPTGDGICNIVDALRMAQCSVGLVSCDMSCGAVSCGG
ncbi:MAG: endonuclease/exonuclease/phosphatase family protein [Candidatus Binatia bacterium]